MKRVVLLVETSREFGRQLIMGIARYARLHGPWSFYKEPIGLKSSIPHLTRWKPDGIIMRDSMINKELLKLNIPTVLAIHSSDYPKNLPVIRTDSRAIARMASGHLVQKGFTRFAYCGMDGYEWSDERKKCFAGFNAEAGFQTHEYTGPKGRKVKDWEEEQKRIGEWLKTVPKPVGLMTCNDDQGQHVLEVCKRTGLRVPEDVAVLGVDNDPMICEIGDPPLSSISLNVESAGFEAARLLADLFRGRKMRGQQIYVTPTHVVQRQSTDILAVSDPEVAAAMRYIRANAKNKMLVMDVVRQTRVSRRTLEERFKKTVHKSVYDEIRQVRVEWISRLLMETDLPISQITALFNFTDVEHISRYFRKEKGMGLREFRKLHQPK
ncbi:DNA-binding transcriptional regulator [bacterium]|nr:DNA-binding transcriptional regulator [bacterium]